MKYVIKGREAGEKKEGGKKGRAGSKKKCGVNEEKKDVYVCVH